MSNFILDCINGDALMTEVDDYIEKWHEGHIGGDLHDFLGMSKKEYALFVDDENYLGLIITAHRDKITIEDIIQDELSMAARSDDISKAKRLKLWLQSEGLWD